MPPLLLDTHIFLWAISGDKRLGKSAVQSLETTQLVYVSALSFLEMRIKQAIGQLRLPADFEQSVSALGFSLLPMSGEQLAHYRIFSTHNHDPFDNALLAIAEQQHVQFMTADAKILELQQNYPWIVENK